MERDYVQFPQLIAVSEFRKTDKIANTKSGTVSENEHLSAIVSAWSSLPPHIQEVILLLIRQYVQ